LVDARWRRSTGDDAGGSAMSKVSVEIPDELLADLDEHVGEDAKFVNRSDAIRASIRKTLDRLDEIDERQGRLPEEDDA
jgi:Arc/MetJ-type ribon-helix-helix transcriptional regulator